MKLEKGFSSVDQQSSEIASFLGLQMWLNMRPYSQQQFNPMYTRYSIGITNKRDLMDQKRNTIHIRAGNSNFWMVKLTKTPILPNFQVPNGFFCTTVNFIIQELKVFQIVQIFFCESVSLVSGKSERIEKKFETEKSNLS